MCFFPIKFISAIRRGIIVQRKIKSDEKYIPKIVALTKLHIHL